jgi:hypothetical protein
VKGRQTCPFGFSNTPAQGQNEQFIIEYAKIRLLFDDTNCQTVLNYRHWLSFAADYGVKISGQSRREKN